MAINPKGTPVLTEILRSVTLPADVVVRFVPTADEEHFFTEAYRRFADATQRFSLEAPTASRPHARCTSRSPRIRNTSKSTRKAASSGTGDPDPEPESFHYPLIPALLHKSAAGRTTPIPRRTYPMRTVCGVPSAVKRFKIAAQI